VETPTRPYRPCRFLQIPQHSELVTAEMIRSKTLALQSPKAPPRAHRVCNNQAKAIEALNHLSASRADAYSSWLAVGMALHSVDQDLLGEWDRWSRSCPEKYKVGKCEEKWNSFTRSEGGIGIGILIVWVKQDGWAPPWAEPAPAPLESSPPLNAIPIPAFQAGKLIVNVIA